jgi:hypothetical protein
MIKRFVMAPPRCRDYCGDALSPGRWQRSSGVLASTNSRRPVPGQRGQLHQNAAHLGLLRRKVELFQARVLPPALIVEWVLLTWLSIFGMLWPLAVLPARPQWIVSKGLILTCFAVGVLGFVVYLAYELEQLRRLGQFEWTKED